MPTNSRKGFEIDATHEGWTHQRSGAFTDFCRLIQRAGAGPLYLAIMLLCVAALSSAQPDVTFTVYPVPETSGGIPGITPGPDGALWFTTWNSIWRLTTAGVMTEYPLPDDGVFYPQGRGATDITTGPDGALWFTEGAAYKIGRITTAGVISEYPLPNHRSPQRIVTGSDGALWFTEFIDRIGRITVDGTISEFQLTPCAGTCGRYPNGITGGPDGSLWFTDLGDDRIHSITTTGMVTDYGPLALVLNGYAPGDIIPGPERALWFTGSGGTDILGRITTAGVMTLFPLPIYPRPTYNGYNNLVPSSITTGPDGALWFASSRVSVIGRMSTQGEVTLYPLPPLGIGDESWISRSITLGPDGALWIGNAGCIVRASVRNGRSPTTTTLASSLNPSLYGQAVTWAAMVTTSGSVPPTGTVAFRWSNSGRIFTIGTATLNAGGVAMLTRPNLNADPFGVPYPIVAVYSGDAVNAASTSGVLSQRVMQTRTAASITSSTNPSTQGQALMFTAKITSPTVIVTGPVTFSVGTSILGTAQLKGGIAKFTTSALPMGSNTVKVTYYGNSNVAKSSASLVQTVR
jgi:virginiamycin B lyase